MHAPGTVVNGGRREVRAGHAGGATHDLCTGRQETAGLEDFVIWIVSAFFAGAYLGAIAFAAVAAWRDAHPVPRARGVRPPPAPRWDVEPRTVTGY